MLTSHWEEAVQKGKPSIQVLSMIRQSVPPSIRSVVGGVRICPVESLWVCWSSHHGIKETTVLMSITRNIITTASPKY